MANYTDLRTVEWTVASSPIPILSLSLFYIYIVYFAGPQFMKNRKPYSLKWVIRCYNILQVVANFYLVCKVMVYAKPLATVWRYCESFDDFYGPDLEKIFEIMVFGMSLKFFDLIETIVFVLRKKNRQISFLHTYHHLSTILFLWGSARYYIHSFLMCMAFLNGIVHTIMYSYYFLSTFGPNMQQKLLPLKKQMTTIQIVHIAFLMGVPLRALVPSCGNSDVKLFSALTILNGIVVISTFFQFYYSAYKKSKKA
ncbi:PREDICTED: elongation of very long chain fatty acids protein 1-like [Vollenhovia emeryi]|uniref:elongation of very long chain fatty acids protein 1-like n=1 Tax=Vollenhovia emeryi TaxID=411798 RepID=UPI0005F4AF4D|nr:PREDICTED: elongation of very long chain fatty acids protein 1-like [Vollenhovia emeryi]